MAGPKGMKGHSVFTPTPAPVSHLECPKKRDLVDTILAGYAELDLERPETDIDPTYLKRKPKKKPRKRK